MDKVKNFISGLPMGPLLFFTAWMLIAPYPAAPEPHLVEKAKMLMSGALTKPLDIFDVFWHLLPATVLSLKLIWARPAPKD